MSKHTPGPWSYDEDEEEIHSDSMQESGGDPAHICALLGPNKKANAKIITSAPVMLELLRMARDSLCAKVCQIKRIGPIMQVEHWYDCKKMTEMIDDLEEDK